MERMKTYRYYFFLLALAILALWPVAMMWHPLKYDLIDQAYPWKYFIGECLQEGILPLWNPYQLLGSPIHADPQSSAWYPFTWFFGYLFGYNIYTISVDFILHVFLAGMGMFYLGKQLRLRDESAFFMAVAYMLSGFFIGNAQHFMWVISGTWIPFVLGAFLALKERPGPDGVFRFALAFFMILSGGYPAFYLLLAYLLIAIYVLFSVQYIRRREYTMFFRFTRYSLLAAGVSILMSAVALVGMYHLQDAITRSGGVTLKQALFGAFTPKSFISFILPFAAIREMEVYNTDLSMSNAYFGLIPLVFFLAALFVRRNALLNLFLGWGLFCLLAATGDATPLREFLFNYMPGMDQFRFPALFRLYAILCFAVIAGFGFDSFHVEDLRLKVKGLKFNKRLVMPMAAVGMTITGFLVYAALAGNTGFREFLSKDLFTFSERSTIVQHILFQGTIQLILLALLWFILWKKEMKFRMAGILVLACFDLVLAARLNGPYTVYYQNFKSKDIYSHSRNFPQGFPLPGNEPIIGNKDMGSLTYQVLWRNLNIFHKTISYQGYNPLHLKGFEEMADHRTRTFETILGNPLVYLSGRISPVDSMKLHEGMQDLDRSRVYVEGEVYEELVTQGLKLSRGDEASVIRFSPVEIAVSCKNQGPVLLNLLQNHYYGWKATINGNPAGIITANMGFISVPVPAGEHEVVFEYHPWEVLWGFYITLIMLVIALVYLKEFRRRGTLQKL